MKKVFLLLLFFQIRLLAQTDQEIAFQQIKDLKNGVLIVLIETSQNKLEALEKAKQKSSNQAEISKEIEGIKNKIAFVRQETKLAFDSIYTFSKVLFAPDTILKTIHKKSPSYFYNENWDVVEKVLDNENYYFLYQGITQSIGMEAYIIGDKNGKDLKPPFPYYVKRNNLGNNFLNIFDKSKEVNRKIKNVIQTLDSRLSRFYLGMLEKEQLAK